jgi:hypothetical protein
MTTSKTTTPNLHAPQIKRLLKKEIDKLERDYDENHPGYAVNKDLFFNTPTEEYNDYLTAINPHPSELWIPDAANYLKSFYGAVPYRHSCFVLQNPNPLFLSQWANHAAWQLIALKAQQASDNSKSPLFSEATIALCLQIICGWPRQTNLVGRLGYAAGRHHSAMVQSEFDKSPAFIFSLFCELQNLPFNDTVFEYLDDDFGVYAPIIANWRTKDVNQVHEWVNQMADYHLEQTKKPLGVEWGEFELPGIYLFPYEILAFLRLREWLGLPNPTQFDHPLMNQPMAFMPSASLPVPAFDDLSQQVIVKYRKQYSEILQNLTPAHFDPVVVGLTWAN